MTRKFSEVTVFTVGDSEKLSTWSNLPYFFTDMLIQNGIKVNRVDISPSHRLEKIYNLTFQKILKFIFPDTTFDYFRSGINYFLTRRLIKKKSSYYSKSDLNIFLTFSFSSSGVSKIPCIQFCDWTYHHYIDFFLERKPDYLERKFIRREDALVRKSDMVITLYPGIKEYLSERYNNPNTFCFGNIVNSMSKPVKDELINTKLKSFALLFIGTKKYYEAAMHLLDSFKELATKYPKLNLHIIGLNKEDFESLPENVNCYGYLDKTIEKDKEVFYSLMKNAKVFINTTPKWGGFSSVNEAMHQYTPVIVRPFPEFIKTFGNDIDFGYFCDGDSAATLRESIKSVFEDKNYKEKCIKAHDAVKEFEWPVVVNKFITKAEEVL